MSEIIQAFSQFIYKQHLVLKLIFGNDIYNIIKIYLPDCSVVTEYNYLYIHKHVHDHDDNECYVTGFLRQKIPNNSIINSIRKMVDINQDINQINLRLRYTAILKDHDFKKRIDYGSLAVHVQT